jgi:hypothetical protein
MSALFSVSRDRSDQDAIGFEPLASQALVEGAETG